jgi:hypothetical protein
LRTGRQRFQSLAHQRCLANLARPGHDLQKTAWFAQPKDERSERRTLDQGKHIELLNGVSNFTHSIE